VRAILSLSPKEASSDLLSCETSGGGCILTWERNSENFPDSNYRRDKVGRDVINFVSPCCVDFVSPSSAYDQTKPNLIYSLVRRQGMGCILTWARDLHYFPIFNHRRYKVRRDVVDFVSPSSAHHQTKPSLIDRLVKRLGLGCILTWGPNLDCISTFELWMRKSRLRRHHLCISLLSPSPNDA
jgi:hypothetical protein